MASVSSAAMVSYFLLVIIALLASVQSEAPIRVCESIRVESCRGLGFWNSTSMPNFAGHETQADADLMIQTFAPLVQFGCSSQLRFLLCAVYVPMCTEKVVDNIAPCRPLCQNVKERCHPVLVEFGFPWPASLDCDKFPEENNRYHMCMDGPGEEIETPPEPVVVKSSTTTVAPVIINNDDQMPTKKPSDPVVLIPGIRPAQSPSRKFFTSTSICSKFRHASEYFYVNRTETCSHKCEADILFSRENKDFAEMWLLIWSSTCLVVSGIAVCFFLIDSSHFRYPERIIVIMSFTYFMCSIGYFVRIMFGRSAIACHQEQQHNVSLLITEGPDNFSCTIVFVIIYFFGMSSALWWVNLTISCFLSAGLNWSSEAIERKSSYFHFFAWFIPAIKTLAILIMREVDADELTGSCFVGNHSKSTLIAFLIVPRAVYLLTGTLLLLACICCFYLKKTPVRETCSPASPHGSQHSSCSFTHMSSRVHSASASIGHHNHVSSFCNPKDALTMQELRNWKISCFTIFYMLPAFFMLAFNVYEYRERDSWYMRGSPDRPSLELYTIMIFMNFVIGIQSGLWIWSLRSPAEICGQVCARFRSPKQITQPKPSYLISVPPSCSDGLSLPSRAPSLSAATSYHLPLPVRQPLLPNQDLDQISNHSRLRSRSRGDETTV
jgi:frizzled protein 4